MNYLPNKLLKLRKHYNYSQQYVAEVLGIETLEYMSYENGKEILNYNQMKKIASLYHIDLVDIFKNSEDVPLYDVDKANTDEINIAYFMPEKNIFEKALDFINEHKIATGIIVGLVFVVTILSLILGNSENNEPHVVKKDDINRLSVSETTVVYINDNGTVKYTGDNSNGQTIADSSIAVKVVEGEGFTVILNEDGSIVSSGIDKYEKELSSWSNIVDVAAGNKHVIGVDANGKVYCVGDNSYEQCELNGTKNIRKVYASANGSICIDREGSIICKGQFTGSGNIKSYTNILDLDTSEDILVILKQDNTLAVFAKDNSNYLQAESWTDIIDVACGNDFVAGLDSHGRVHIEIENNSIENQVNDWSNIKAIDAGNNYLIGFDGTYIYGVGKNKYGQFNSSEIEKAELNQVSDVFVDTYKDYVEISFSGIDNATGYLISINVETGIEVYLDASETATRIKTTNMIDGYTYTIYITSKGDTNYKDSEKLKYKFTYEAYEGEENEAEQSMES